MTSSLDDSRVIPDRAVVLGCRIDRLDMAGTLARVKSMIERRELGQQASVNAAKLVALQHDPELRQVISRCALVNADGQSVVWASRLLGDRLPERVAGIDLMHEIMALAEREGYGVYILGARAEVLERAVKRLQERHPQLRLVGYQHGYFDEADDEQVAAQIRAANPDVLFVAMSSPRKEYWLGAHGPELGVPFLMGVGGSVDVIAGHTQRAPALWQRLGMEWAYRLVQEPRRMWRRYLVTNTQFLWLLSRAMFERGNPGRRTSCRQRP
jgi:N-acetylglucosaminyldiphosphoundecaprenol N-acetyl-beta-D-mannosaminyltransferase